MSYYLATNCMFNLQVEVSRDNDHLRVLLAIIRFPKCSCPYADACFMEFHKKTHIVAKRSRTVFALDSCDLYNPASYKNLIKCQMVKTSF